MLLQRWIEVLFDVIRDSGKQKGVAKVVQVTEDENYIDEVERKVVL